MVEQGLACRFGEAGEIRTPQFLGHADGKVACQQGYVFPTLPQRRQGDHVESEPVQQILAESPAGGELWQVDVGRGHQSHVGLQRFAAAESFELAVLHDPQQFFLQGA